MNDLLGAFLLFLFSALPVVVVVGYRRLRNLDRLHAALHMTYTAQEATRASQEQLAICRALLATTMRERDNYEKAVDALARKLARIEQARRKERAASRYWLTRTVIQRKVSEN